MGCKGQRLFLQAERAGGTLEAVPSFLSPTQQQWEQQQLSATYPPPGKSYWGPAPRSCKIQESEASFVLPIDKPWLTICNWNHSKEYSIAMRSSMKYLTGHTKYTFLKSSLQQFCMVVCSNWSDSWGLVEPEGAGLDLWVVKLYFMKKKKRHIIPHGKTMSLQNSLSRLSLSRDNSQWANIS